jgi:hypothetical protein
MKKIGSLAVIAGVTLMSASSRANPRPLPFTYNYETLGEGEGEIEQYVDMTPVRAHDEVGKEVTYAAMQYQTEFEYGITDRLELGLYVALQPKPDYVDAATLTEGTGFKERLRYRLAEENEWPVDVALYGELVEYDVEFEIEAKIILQKRFGKLRIAANAWAEREWYYELPQRDWVINPTVGATYQVTPTFNVGAEYWMRAEFPDPAPATRTFNLGPHQFVGPAVMFNFGKIWWSTGVYVRVDDMSHTAQPLDNYGPVWVRTVIGVTL